MPHATRDIQKKGEGFDYWTFTIFGAGFSCFVSSRTPFQCICLDFASFFAPLFFSFGKKCDPQSSALNFFLKKKKKGAKKMSTSSVFASAQFFFFEKKKGAKKWFGAEKKKVTKTIDSHNPIVKHNGLGCSHFARRYSGNRFCFLFLWLLRCFSSPGCLFLFYEFRKVVL